MASIARGVTAIGIALVVVGCADRSRERPARASAEPVAEAAASATAASGTAVAPAAERERLAVADDPAVREQRLRTLADSAIDPLEAGGTGYYMDVQEARLRQQLAGTAVGIVREGERIRLDLGSIVEFETGSAVLAPDVHAVLDAIAGVLREFARTLISLEGHTDSDGPEDFNYWLSGQRALALGRYFVDTGVDHARLVVMGYGEAHPLASNETAEGRSRNRRVEMVIDPIVRARTEADEG